MNAAAPEQNVSSLARLSRETAQAQVQPPLRRSLLSVPALLRDQATALIDWTLNAEFDALLAQHASITDRHGRAAYVRNGYQPARELLTNLGPVDIRIPKLRSRIEPGIVFRSALARPYQRRARVAIDKAPALFLVALGSGNLRGAIGALMGPEAAALPAAVMRRLAERWRSEREPWLTGPLEGLRLDALWLDSVDGSEDPSCGRGAVMVAVAARESASDRILAIVPGADDGEDGWASVLRGLRDRGLRPPPRLQSSRSSCCTITAAAARIYPCTAFETLTSAAQRD